MDSVDLQNTCKDQKQITVGSYNSGRLVETRTFHLMAGEVREIRQSAQLATIVEETDWTDGADGSRWVRLTVQPVQGGKLWLAENLHPSQFLALGCTILKNKKPVGTASGTIAPGRPLRLYWFRDDEKGTVFPNFVYLDPE